MSASKGNGKEPRKLKPYRSYRFVDHDPMMDKVVIAVENSGLTKSQIFKGNITPTTYGNWKKHRTKRPQHATLAATAGAVGLRFELRQAKPK